MQLEDYFDFQRPDDIRLKGSRIGIETVLYDYIHRARTAEEIADDYHTLSLEQVYATILYYWHNKEAVDRYLTDWREYCERSEREFDANPPSEVKRLLAVKDRVTADVAANA